MKKVLIITYYWPPAGGPGVQRVLKFAKYLPEFGWQPVVLTVKNGVYPASDKSLQKEIHPDCKVYKSNSFEFEKLYKKISGIPDDERIPIAVLAQKPVSIKKKILNFIRLNLFIPDAKILWLLSGFRVGKKIIKNEQPDLIFSSSPPPTAHLIASKLSKQFKLKWIADFRDPWSRIHYYKNRRNRFVQNLDQKLEVKIQKQCDMITCASKEFAKLLMINDKDKVNVIYNGYDEYEKPAASERKNNNLFKIVYVGGLNRNRYYPGFFEQLSKMLSEQKIDPEKCSLTIAGMIENTIKKDLDTAFKSFNNYQYMGYVSHQDALNLMFEADLLLLFQENVAGYEGHVPAKLFEYLSSGKRILGVGNPEGDAAHILADTGVGAIYHPDSDFSEILVSIYNGWRQNSVIEIPKDKLKPYTRKFLTEKLSRMFESTINESE